MIRFLVRLGAFAILIVFGGIASLGGWIATSDAWHRAHETQAQRIAEDAAWKFAQTHLPITRHIMVIRNDGFEVDAYCQESKALYPEHSVCGASPL